MKKLVKMSLIVSGLVLSGISAVRAELIDFDGVNFDGKTFLEMGSYSEDGFNINATLDIGDFFLVPGPGSEFFLLSPDLIIQQNEESAILSSQTGALFTLNSAVLRGVYKEEEIENFSGNFSAFDADNNLKGIQGFTFPDTADLHNLSFGDDFKNIASVKWGTIDSFYAVDNIDLTQSVVPEPVSLLLYGLGGVTLAFFRGGRRQDGSG